MPTYYCNLPQNLINETEKLKMANAITRRHTEATGAPSWFVQVIIEDDCHHSRYLGGMEAKEHIWIRADIRAGRSKAQLHQLMLNIKDDVAKITGVNPVEIWIYLNNIEADNMLEYGHVLPLPGQESMWFEALPIELQARLEKLGINHDNFTL